MTAESGESESTSLQRIIDKTQARRMVVAMLEGSGLKIRMLKNELVITNPDDPERGQIYVEYANGCVTWERTVYEYWEPLQGYTDDDKPLGAGVGAGRIIEALTGRSPETAGSP